MQYVALALFYTTSIMTSKFGVTMDEIVVIDADAKQISA